jgi:hypothetical protein
MLIVYDQTTGEIVGHCSSVFDGGKWREATVSELFPNRANLSSVIVADDARFIGYGPNAWRLKKDANGVVTGIERLPALRTTRGTLAQRSAPTAGGTATVELRSAIETVSLTVTASAPGYRTGRLNMEFVPVPVSPPVFAPHPA